MKLSYGLLLWIALLFPATAIAFQNTPSPQMSAANNLFNDQKWEEAAKAYEAIVAAEPTDPVATAPGSDTRRVPNSWRRRFLLS